jgi:hypothetical protein
MTAGCVEVERLRKSPAALCRPRRRAPGGGVAVVATVQPQPAESSSNPCRSRRECDIVQGMSEWREWDFPPYPERLAARRRRVQAVPGTTGAEHGRTLRTSEPALHLRIVTQGYRPRRWTLYDRFLAIIARGMVATARFTIGFAVGIGIAVLVVLVVTVIRL